MMSNRARRMAVHHQRHQAGFELNLIPLIDILSVMVSFLLVYSTEVGSSRTARASKSHNRFRRPPRTTRWWS